MGPYVHAGVPQCFYLSSLLLSLVDGELVLLFVDHIMVVAAAVVGVAAAEDIDLRNTSCVQHHFQRKRPAK